MKERTETPAELPLDLAVVVPVHNEEACIEAFLRSWIGVLEGLVPRFRILVRDDGSRDATPRILASLARDPRVVVASQPNRGHGPTILLGYHEACRLAEWVFQTDGDDEISAREFPGFWARRHDFDAIVGSRVNRLQAWDRRWVSRVSRFVVHACFGAAVVDVNCPYRLLRASVLGPILARIPPSTFAPNLLIAGALGRSGARVLNRPVEHTPRRTGAASLVRWGIFRAAMTAFGQTLRWRVRG